MTKEDSGDAPEFIMRLYIFGIKVSVNNCLGEGCARVLEAFELIHGQEGGRRGTQVYEGKKSYEFVWIVLVFEVWTAWSLAR